jgi:hypothetical protein
MIAEYNLGGVLVSSLLVSAFLAVAITFVLRQVLVLARLYRFVWHPALLDSALFVIVWAAVVALSSSPSL